MTVPAWGNSGRPIGEALSSFRDLVPKATWEGAIEHMRQHPLPVLRFTYKNLCGSEKGSMAWNLGAISSLAYERANEFAKKMQQCPKHCSPNVNRAEFCGYVRELNLETAALKRWEKGLFEANNLLQTASEHSRLPEEQLRVSSRLVTNSAIALLHADIAGEQTQETGRMLTVRELRDLRDMLTVLADAGIIKGAVASVASALDRAARSLDAADKHVDDNRRSVVLAAAADLAWVAQAMDRSAENALHTEHQRPVTTAADFRAAIYGHADWMRAAACFERLSLDASTAAGGIQSELELLTSCRDASACSKVRLRHRPGLEKLLDNVDKSMKAQYAVTGSMCHRKAN